MVGYQGVDHPVEIVEEGQEVERQLEPTFSLALIECVCVHNGGRIVEPGAAHHGPIQVPVDVVGDEGHIQHQREPFPGEQEHHVENNMQDVLGQNQRV